MLKQLKPALSVQITHLALSAIWNIAGLILISRNLHALGPTASLTTAALLLVLGILLVFGAVRYRPLYIAVSGIVALAALSTVVGAFSKPPGSWPSDFWRYAGAALNSLGVVGAVWGMSIVWHHKNKSLNQH